jgi:Sigma-70 region 2
MGVESRPASFDEYVAARGHALLRLAYLLTGDQADAEDLAQSTLLRTMIKWRWVQRAGRHRPVRLQGPLDAPCRRPTPALIVGATQRRRRVADVELRFGRPL